MSQHQSDQARRIENLLSLGTIAETDDAGQRLRLSLAGRVTGELQYPADIGRNYVRWSPQRVGTQVLAACPSGDPANAMIVARLYSTAIPRPEMSSDQDVIVFSDGTMLKYDVGTGELTIIAPKIRITGDIEVTGSITATGTIIDAGGNTNHHSH